MKTVLIASYPKSGNTWVRCLIEALRYPDLTSIDINRITTAAVSAADVDLIDCFSGIDVEGLSPSETLACRRRAYETAFNLHNSQTLFLKVHDANVRTSDGRLFHKGNTSKCIYIVRSPLDVAPSYAHHNSGAVTPQSLDQTIAHMADPDAHMEDHLPSTRQRGRRTAGLAPQPLMRWDQHVQSYVDEFDGPLLLCRYEDLHRAPMREAARIADFLALEYTPETLERACHLASFQKLAGHEEAAGFTEAPSAAPYFFRSGRIGDGDRLLSPEHQRAMREVHGIVMGKLGY